MKYIVLDINIEQEPNETVEPEWNERNEKSRIKNSSDYQNTSSSSVRSSSTINKNFNKHSITSAKRDSNW